MMSLVPFRRIMNSSCSISKEPIMTTTATIMFALFIVIGAAAGGGVCEVDAFSFLESSSSTTARSSSTATSGGSRTRISMRNSPSSNTYKNRGQERPHRRQGWTNDHYRSGSAATISPTRPRSQSSSMMMMQLASSSSESSFEVNVQTPTQEEAESFGIREWSQQAWQQGTFIETAAASDATTTTTRYVLEGEGQLTVVSSSATTTIAATNENDNDNKKQVVKLRPGTLVEVTGGGGGVQLDWDITSKEMILLTPGFEEIGLFVGVLVGFVGLVGALVTLS
mmetsp:Transcript_4753/g.12075  ORF Transcript_4753/g.12075 Transcript_4753/m.12075 type:complete len:281 (+) Transcript_4753:3-845(+)